MMAHNWRPSTNIPSVIDACSCRETAKSPRPATVARPKWIKWAGDMASFRGRRGTVCGAVGRLRIWATESRTPLAEEAKRIDSAILLVDLASKATRVRRRWIGW